MAYCKNCGVELNDVQAVCVKCGAKVGSGTAYCSYCGKELPAGADVCMSCGVAVKKKDAFLEGELGGQNKVVLAIVCFLLGSIGIHNFMMGEVKKGIFKIVMAFCFGISTILMLIDLVRILTDKYVVDPTKLI